MMDNPRLLLACFCVCIGVSAACLCVAADGEAVSPSGSPAGTRGFVMELTSLIGEYGGIRAIAPGARALAGSIRFAMEGDRFSPFVWSRENGLTMLATAGPESWGTALFTSDDGAVAIGVVHKEGIEKAGFIWRPGFPTVVANNAFFIIRVDWAGLTADGRLAAGGNGSRYGFLVENGERLMFLPGARNFNHDIEVWASEPTIPRRDGSVPDDEWVDRGEPLSAMSRDGSRFAFADFVMDADRREIWWPTLAGQRPGQLYREDGTPVERPAKRRRMDEGELRYLPLLKDSPDHPLPLKDDAILSKIRLTHLDYDGSHVLGSVIVRYPLSSKDRARDLLLRMFSEGGSVDMESEEFVVRWDAAGNAVLVASGDRMRPVAMSDDGRTVLVRNGYDIPHVWREGERLVTLREFLNGYGVILPEEYSTRMWSLVMSPDGRCFAGSQAVNGPRSRTILACVCEEGGELPDVPSWETPDLIHTSLREHSPKPRPEK